MVISFGPIDRPPLTGASDTIGNRLEVCLLLLGLRLRLLLLGYEFISRHHVKLLIECIHVQGVGSNRYWKSGIRIEDLGNQ